MGPCSTDEARPHHSELGFARIFLVELVVPAARPLCRRLEKENITKSLSKLESLPFVSANGLMFGSLYLAIKVVVSGLSEIDITMPAEKLSVGRKERQVEEHGQFSVLVHSGGKLGPAGLVTSPYFS